MRPMTSERLGFSRDQGAIGSIAIGVLFVVAAVVLVGYTRRIELGAVVALPLVLLLLSNFRLAATVTIWVALIWLLRIPAVFFDLVQFSYVLYACVALTLGAYLLRLGMGERKQPSAHREQVDLAVDCHDRRGRCARRRKCRNHSVVGIGRLRCRSGSALDLLQDRCVSGCSPPPARDFRRCGAMRQTEAERDHDACLDVGVRNRFADRRAGGDIGRAAVGDGDPAQRASDKSRVPLQ